ncbi:hypothetical protein KL953_09040 [Mycolicibacterium goodii]|uniref:hypothetical protein n=1 Tax=Mycolicibacterium goodii TaxID=134601 RepID=UPI001BDC7DB3|nr:hypothetical protein [Mycolicibacterium goodii]MBU8809040.1 hypothetical protein [Mycolicibacterium goodii]MBU8817989.1 hypothetical protein [Mycolicibacterium goodii]
MTELRIPSLLLGGPRPTPSREAVAFADRSVPQGLGDQLLALYARCDGFLTDSGTVVGIRGETVTGKRLAPRPGVEVVTHDRSRVSSGERLMLDAASEIPSSSV